MTVKKKHEEREREREREKEREREREREREEEEEGGNLLCGMKSKRKKNKIKPEQNEIIKKKYCDTLKIL